MTDPIFNQLNISPTGQAGYMMLIVTLGLVDEQTSNTTTKFILRERTSKTETTSRGTVRLF